MLPQKDKLKLLNKLEIMILQMTFMVNTKSLLTKFNNNLRKSHLNQSQEKINPMILIFLNIHLKKILNNKNKNLQLSYFQKNS